MTRGSTTNCCLRIAPIARDTASMSALTKFSVTGSPEKRAFGDCAKAAGGGTSAAHSSVAASVAGQTRRERGPEGRSGFMLIRSK